jgi:hypothetical protein
MGGRKIERQNLGGGRLGVTRPRKIAYLVLVNGLELVEKSKGETPASELREAARRASATLRTRRDKDAGTL